MPSLIFNFLFYPESNAALMHGKLLENRQNWKSQESVIAKCTLSQGSCSLSVFKLTPEGLKWAKTAKAHQDNPSENIEDYSTKNHESVQIILSDKFHGSFMTPSNGGMWNYNFNGVNFSENMKFGLCVDNPKDFYHEIHRVQHFMEFIRQQEDTTEDEAQTDDRDDNFS